MESKIKLLVTTMNEKIRPTIDKFIKFSSKNTDIIISHQIIDENIKPINVINDEIKYLYMNTKGLSKNRNNILSHIDNDGIGIICDDDISLVNWFEKIIQESYSQNPDADVITFQSITPKWVLRKKYKKKNFTHNKISILSVSSIEITFKIASIKSKWILFDERFGLGTNIPSWEENIFLKDCLDKWLKVIYILIPLTIHPEYTSSVNQDNKSLKAKAKLFHKLYGKYIWFLVYITFAVLKYDLYKNKYSFFQYVSFYKFKRNY